MGLHKKDVMMMNLVSLDFKESCADHASNTELMKNQLGCGIFVVLNYVQPTSFHAFSGGYCTDEILEAKKKW